MTLDRYDSKELVYTANMLTAIADPQTTTSSRKW